jgi:quercetin dioxygenase-like cupin family protein
MHTNGPTDLIAQDIVYHPGDTSGWHYHPGLVLVENEGPGTVTARHGCEVSTVPPNASFSETGHHPIQVENNSTENFTVHVMYVLPTGAPARINTDPPNCDGHHGHHGHSPHH